MTEPLIALVVFIGAVVQASAGIGFALLCVPMLALIDATLVPGPMLIAMLSLSLLMAILERHAVDASEFVVLIPTLFAGTLLGAGLLLAMNAQDLGVILGISVLIAVAITVSGVSAVLNRRNLGLAGLAAGIMGTIAGIHGPPLAILYANQSPPKARATIAWIFIVGSSFSLTALTMTGQLDWLGIQRGIYLIPGTLIGFAAAALLRHRMSANFVRVAMLSLTAISALVLTVRTWMAG